MNTLIILQAQAQGGSSSFLIMMGLMLVVMYVFMIRPQQKKMKLHKKFIDNIAKGESIVTTGGIHGKVVSLNEGSTIVIESEGTRLKIEKSSISNEMSAALNAAPKA